MLSWGTVRRVLRPVFVQWLNRQGHATVTARVQGLDLKILPGVFHPKYFGSSGILAKFVSSLALRDKAFLEMGCGSGVVALCAARAGAKVTAVDINPDAAQCTLINAAANQLRVSTHVSDLFSALQGKRFDAVAWNPPFFPGTPNTPIEAAFYGGPNLEVIRRFVTEVRTHLNPGASVFTILSSDIAVDEIEQLFRNEGFSVSRPVSQRWGLGETMVIVCAQ
jgi:release factor glutamine methyltransferase